MSCDVSRQTGLMTQDGDAGVRGSLARVLARDGVLTWRHIPAEEVLEA